VSLSLAGSPLAEAGGTATVTATLSAASSFPVTVSLGFSGTATNLTDYTRSATVITIPADMTSGSITLTGVDDALDEADESIVVDIAGVTNVGIVHTYRDNSPPGGPPYTITLTVSDSSGATGTATQAIAVANVAPALTLTGAGSTSPGIAEYTLNLAARDPGADTIDHWTIDWGDGTLETVPGTATAVTHVFARCTTYTVTATATDEDGAFAAGDAVTVVATLPTRNPCFVAQVYAGVLGRPVDGVGLPAWSAQLDRGVAPADIVLAIEQFPEAREAQVEAKRMGPGLATMRAPAGLPKAIGLAVPGASSSREPTPGTKSYPPSPVMPGPGRLQVRAGRQTAAARPRASWLWRPAPTSACARHATGRIAEIRLRTRSERGSINPPRARASV
jgi:hypothetical protein